MIVSRFIIELIGRPKEVLIKGLDKVTTSFEERYKVLHKEISKPEPIKKSTLLSAFIEVEFEVENFSDLFSAVLDFGPNVVEIIEPKEIKIKRSELQDSLVDLTSKIHEMSNLIQELSVQNMQLNQQINSPQKSNKKR